MQLSPSQQQGLLDFKEFIVNPNKTLCKITGGAGMGKSTLVDQCIQSLAQTNKMQAYLGKDPIEEVILSATTNKAAEVLAEMGLNHSACEEAPRTIQSNLGLRMFRDYDTGKEELKPAANFHKGMHQNKLVFIDEASYMDKQLNKYRKKGMQNCKIVLVGDDHQLSSVSDPNYNIFLDEKFDTSIELKENMRFDPNSDLGKLNQQLRDNVFDNNRSYNIKPNNQDIFFADDSNIHWWLNEAFVKGSLGEVRMLGFLNRTCVNINNTIRQMKNATLPYHKGEQLVVAQAWAPDHSKSKLFVEQQLTVMEDCKTPAHCLGVDGYWVETNRGVYAMPTDYQVLAQALKYYAKQKSWQEFYELKDYFVDARPDYAKTAHKSQGSSYDTVIIDFNDLYQMSAVQDMAQFARAFYVACSRAKTRVVIYGYPT